MTGDQLVIDVADDGNIPYGLGKWKGNGAEAAVGSERRRSAALAEPGLSKNDGGTGRDEVDGHPGDDLVAAMGNRGEAVNECEKAGNEDRRAQPDPCGAVDCGSGAGGEGTCQH